MKNPLLPAALTVAAVLAGPPVSAHHSYAAFETDRIVDYTGLLEEFDVVAPHSRIKIKTEEGRLVIGEWLAPVALTRRGVDPALLKKGDRIVVAGNPRRDFIDSGIVNVKSVTRPADGLTWAAPPARPR